MNSFSLCTATREKDYFFILPSDPARAGYAPNPDPALDKREKIWRSPGSPELSFALASRRGEVTFSAGPLISGREDRVGRPVVNYVITQSTDPDDRRQMGRIFAAMLANAEARVKFAKQLETQIVQPVLNGEKTWEGQLPEAEDAPVASDLPDEAVQQTYPAAADAAAKWAGWILALIESGRDFAVGLSDYSGDSVAKKLQQVYSFEWRSTFIAVFSSQAKSPAQLPCPAPPVTRQTPSPQKRSHLLAIIGGIVAFVLLVVGISTCGRHEEKTPPPPYGGDVSRPVPGSQTGK